MIMNIFRSGVCKTRTRYPRMADAGGKMRIEKCGWKKNADSKKSKKKKTRNVDGKKIIIMKIK